MKEDTQRDPRLSHELTAVEPVSVEGALAGVKTAIPRSLEELNLVEHLRETHRSRATNLISIFPETPACAAAVFEALKGPGQDAAGLRFISRAMRAAAEKIDLSRFRSQSGSSGAAASGEFEREVWRNHHLLKRLLRASPELRRIVEALLAIVAAPGVVNRLGEPGFVEALVELLLEEFERCAEAFQRGDVPLDEIRDSIALRMDEFCPEFTAESLAQISPSSLILRRAGYHEHCAQQLSDRAAA